MQLSIGGAKAEQEARDVAELFNLWVVEVRTLDAELVVDIKAGSDEASCRWERSDFEACIHYFGDYCHGSGRFMQAVSLSCRCADRGAVR